MAAGISLLSSFIGKAQENIDYASCHPPSLQDPSIITLKFLPKNTTAKTKPLDSGISCELEGKIQEATIVFCPAAAKLMARAAVLVTSSNS